MKITSCTGHELITGMFRILVVLTIVAGILLQVSVTRALEPSWNYTRAGGETGGIAVSPEGDLIAVGAGRVLFFAKNGTLMTEAPFGSDVRMTADGKYTASAYASTLYYFQNPLPSGSADQQKPVKLWDYELPDQIGTFDMNRDGSLIAGQTLRKNLFIVDTRSRVARGNTKVTDSVIKISGSGVIGLSDSAIHTYTMTGNLTRTEEIVTSSAPRFLVLPSGNTAVFSDGQSVRSVNTYNGTERWKQQIDGAVSDLSMAPGGSLIVAGTETGNIAGVDMHGNLVWSYASNPENSQTAGITCSAVSDRAGVIAAGTADGKVLFLNSRGELTGSYNAHEYIRHIATSADGSVVVAASDGRVYAFFPGSQPGATPSPSYTGTVISATTVPSPAISPNPAGSTAITATMTGTPTTYQVTRTATQSPPAVITLFVSFALVIVMLGRKR
jgi:WD40 repeat protein